jgi:hypothetical protein
MNETEIIEMCRELGIHFVNRSYGKATQSSVTYDAIKKLVAMVEINHRKELIKQGAILPTL